MEIKTTIKFIYFFLFDFCSSTYIGQFHIRLGFFWQLFPTSLLHICIVTGKLLFPLMFVMFFLKPTTFCYLFKL